MNLKIVLTAASRPLPKRNRLRRASGSRTRLHAPCSDAIPFHPVATRKWATIGMESRPASILPSVSPSESAKIWGEFPTRFGGKFGEGRPAR